MADPESARVVDLQQRKGGACDLEARITCQGADQRAGQLRLAGAEVARQQDRITASAIERDHRREAADRVERK